MCLTIKFQYILNSQVLVAVYRTATDERADVNAHTVTCFNRHVTRLIKLLRHQGNRVQGTLEIITISKQTHAQLMVSDSSYQDLLMSMSSRTEVFNMVQTATALKRSLIYYITKLINLRDDVIERILLFYNPYNWRETAGYQ